MPTPALCSVIIPAYNAEVFIGEALESVMQQSYPAIETILVDDGSTDRTAAIAEGYAPRVRCIRLAHTGSPGAVRNAGIRESTGQFLCFLDADDIMTSQRVERQLRFLEAHPAAGVVFADYRNFRGGSVWESTHFETCPGLGSHLAGAPSALIPSAEATTLLLQENFGGTGTAMVRRNIIDSAQPFRPEFVVGEDFHFYYRIAQIHPVGVINEVGLHRRLHGTNITGDPLRVLLNYVATRSALRSSESNPANLKLLDQFLFQAHLGLAREFADRRKFGLSIMHNIRALARVPGSGGHGLWLSIRSMLRTSAIAARLKGPG